MRVAAPMLAPLVLAALVTTAADASWRAGTDPLVPAGIAISGDRVFVTDFDRDRVLVFAPDGTPIGSWGVSGETPGAFHGPAGIAAASGRIVVADVDNHRLQTFTASGEPLAAWSAGGTGGSPCGIAIAPDGRVYATDIDAGVVRCWSADGAPLGAWSGPPAAPLAEPWGIAVGRDGVVWVADHGHDRIARFTADGEWLGGWGVSGIADGRILGPMGLAVAGDGSVLVTDRAGARVQRFDGAGTLLSVSRPPTTDPAHALFAALAVDGATTLVADAGSGAIVLLGDGSAAPAPRSDAPATLALLGITPMPSRGAVTLRWSIPARGTLSAGIYALDGRRIATLDPVACDPGERAIGWSGRTTAGTPAPAGVYFVRVRLDAGSAFLTRDARVVVVR